MVRKRRGDKYIMYYGNIKPCSTENGPGVRLSLFVSGCRNHCKGCFSEQTWDFNYGKPYTEETKNEIIKSITPGYIKGITILGGEPFEPENQLEVLNLVKRIRQEFPQKSIWIYSGFLFEDLINENSKSRGHTEHIKDILSNIDVLVDGKFDIELKNACIPYRGSSNQRIIDMKKTMEQWDTSHTVFLMDNLMNKKED